MLANGLTMSAEKQVWDLNDSPVNICSKASVFSFEALYVLSMPVDQQTSRAAEGLALVLTSPTSAIHSVAEL